MLVKRYDAMAMMAALMLAACAESGTEPERNQPPLAVVASDGVEAGMNRTVTLDAASSIDPDGDEPQFTWTQIAGPDVGPLSGSRPSFTAPDEVSTLRFELVVSDGQAQSNAVRVTVWVIARQNGAVWVSPDGSDDNAGTREAPMATIQGAIDAAASRNSDVYVAEGTYSESVNVRRDVSLYGGYRAGSWLREVGSARSRLVGASPALAIRNAGDVTVDGLEIESADATAAGASSVAVLVSNTRAWVHNSILRAGAGANGASGLAGSAGGNGPAGGSGASQGSCFSSHAGGNGGNAGYDGGKGGSGGSFGGSNGAGGQGPRGGSAGKGGAFSASRINAGGTGGSGGSGSDGGSGSGGKPFGSLAGDAYAPASGSTGGSGASGSGGGGGGGGMGQSVVCGAGGGGGGAGGYGGIGGRGGQGGGASIALLVTGASQVTASGNTIHTSSGGTGGSGGDGGAGGKGGNGGNGGSGSGSGTQGGRGGNGGDGGSGGSGGQGGGGGGGPSIGILHAATSAIAADDNTYMLGAPGPGGIAANPGAAGERVEVRKAQ